jgi:hypothetical protein
MERFFGFQWNVSLNAMGVPMAEMDKSEKISLVPLDANLQ